MELHLAPELEISSAAASRAGRDVEGLAQDVIADFLREVSEVRNMLTKSSGFRLHPGATQDIQAIWEYIASDSIAAAGRIRQQILDTYSWPH